MKFSRRQLQESKTAASAASAETTSAESKCTNLEDLYPNAIRRLILHVRRVADDAVGDRRKE
jgi:phosphoenolpyruvate carboxylase